MSRTLLLVTVLIAGCWDGTIKTDYPMNSNAIADLEFAARQVGCETEVNDWDNPQGSIVKGKKSRAVLTAVCDEGTVFFDSCCAFYGVAYGELDNVKVSCGFGRGEPREALDEATCGSIARRILDEARAI